MRLPLVLGLVALSVTAAAGQTLTDSQVQNAILNATKSKPLILSEALNFSASGYRIEIYSPAAWVQQLARKAKEEFRPFTAADVSPEMREDVWRVKVWPSTPQRMDQTAIASSVSHVVARTEDKHLVIQPTAKTPFDSSVQNSFGAQLKYEGLEAVFPGDGMRELWGAKSDREFVFTVVGPNWNYDFTVKKKHFKQLQ